MVWTTPRTWSVGDLETAALFNSEIRDKFAMIGGAWTAYTPTWTAATTAPAIGNGSLQGYYNLVGKTLDVRIYMLCGSTTTFGSGGYSWSLPSGIASVNSISNVGAALAQIGTTGTSASALVLPNAGTIQVGALNQQWGPANPGTWANGSQMNLQIRLETA